MADYDDSPILEGYICPQCTSKKKFKEADLLLSHFESEHSGETDILKSLQGLLGRAKKKILSFDDSSPESITSSQTNKKYTIHYYKEYWPPQELGASRSHTDLFKTFRNDTLERYYYEINQLIIRLGKLLTNMPTDPLKKKDHEQSIIPWLDGTDVSRCPNCTKSFNFAKRQHHCRLCGCIMCHECSLFLPLNKAKQILDKPNIALSSTTSNLRLRICSYCTEILEKREKRKETQSAEPFIELYNVFVEKRDEANRHCDIYLEMIDSLLTGERAYYASDAHTLRVKLGRLAEAIGVISTKVVGDLKKTSAKDNNIPPTIDERLRKSIRLAASDFIHNRLLTLPKVPSDEQLADLQEKRRLNEEMRRRDAEVEALRTRQDSVIHVENYESRNSSKNNDQNMALLETWSPAGSKLINSQDPLIQQISNIKQFIKEARLAHKYNEVASLESNLKELQEEYFRRQHQEGAID